MEYSSLVDRIDAESAGGWGTLFEAWEARDRGEDVIILSIGDPDFATPAPIVDAAVAALRAGDTHYSEFLGRPRLRELVAERFSSSTGRTWTADNVAITAGTQGALFSAGMCLLDPGTRIIGLEPMYLTYESTLRAGGAELCRVALDPARGFALDPDALAAAVDERTRAVVITTPNNPTGTVATVDELEMVADLARRHDLWVIADEVYAELVYEGEHRSIAALDGMAERTVTVSSLSKSHAMTGWRVGWAIGPAELIDHFSRLNLAMLYGLPGFVQAGAIEALANGDEGLDAMRVTYRRRRDLVVAELAKADDLPVLSPRAGMYVMVDVRSFGMTGDAFAWALFRATGVSVVDAGSFGRPAEGWLRLAFTAGDDELREGCRRLVDFVAGLERRG
ncbi:MAG: pyridoxal phosphate-dependent aminotransferase [Acidimicrobiales bacterium]